MGEGAHFIGIGFQCLPFAGPLAGNVDEPLWPEYATRVAARVIRRRWCLERVNRKDVAARLRAACGQYGFMCYPVVDIQITGVMGIDDRRMNACQFGFDQLNHVQQIN